MESARSGRHSVSPTCGTHNNTRRRQREPHKRRTSAQASTRTDQHGGLGQRGRGLAEVIALQRDLRGAGSACARCWHPAGAPAQLHGPWRRQWWVPPGIARRGATGGGMRTPTWRCAGCSARLHTPPPLLKKTLRPSRRTVRTCNHPHQPPTTNARGRRAGQARGAQAAHVEARILICAPLSRCCHELSSLRARARRTQEHGERVGSCLGPKLRAIHSDRAPTGRGRRREGEAVWARGTESQGKDARKCAAHNVPDDLGTRVVEQERCRGTLTGRHHRHPKASTHARGCLARQQPCGNGGQ